MEASTANTADWLIAFGTIAAVVVALGTQGWISWREHHRRPKLSLSFDRFAYAWESQRDGTQIRYLRLAVSNDRDKHAAEDVEVLILRVDGGPRGGTVFDRWYANAALRWPNERPEDRPRVTVSPAATRYVDVGFWTLSKDNDGGLPSFRFEFALDMKPHSDRHILEPGEYEIELAVVPRNADSSRWIVHMSFESVASDNLQPHNVKYDVGRVE